MELPQRHGRKRQTLFRLGSKIRPSPTRPQQRQLYFHHSLEPHRSLAKAELRRNLRIRLSRSQQHNKPTLAIRRHHPRLRRLLRVHLRHLFRIHAQTSQRQNHRPRRPTNHKPHARRRRRQRHKLLPPLLHLHLHNLRPLLVRPLDQEIAKQHRTDPIHTITHGEIGILPQRKLTRWHQTWR